jgi:sugar lactone lactonase YvrE
MRRSIVAVTAFATASLVFTGGAPAQGVLPEDAKWQKVSSAGRAFGEGVVAAKDGSLYLVDITAALPDNPGGTIYRYDPNCAHARDAARLGP